MPRIQHKRGTSANLASVNPTPLAGELVWDSTENAIKIGDGATAWTSLAYVTATPRSHNHDDRYYTESEVDGLLAGKAASSHTHTFSQISDITFPFPLADNSIVVYTAGVGWGVASAIGTIGVGSQPIGGWPAGSVGASLAGKVDTSDSRLTDARTPTAHKATHATGGSDALTPGDIGAAPAASPAFTGNATFEASSGVPVTITNTGSGNSFVVNDASGDTTPFVVDASGKVAIGSSAGHASRGLLIKGADFSGGSILLQSSATPAGTDVGFLLLCGNNLSYVWNYEANPILFGTGNAERMRLTAAGNLGLGPSRTAPASRLDVNGVITVSATSGSAGSYLPSLTFSGDANTGFGQVSGQSDTASIFTAGHERVRVRADGNVSLGGTGGSNVGLNHQYTLSGASTRYGELIYPTLASGGSATVLVCASGGSMAASSSVTTLACFHASNVTLGAGASVTNQYGVFVGAGFTGGTNNYGIYSAIASGSGRWNFYADSTANNYFGGNVGIGSGTTSPTAALDINADKIRLRTAKTPASASDTGNAGDICWDANYVYICVSANSWKRASLASW